MKPWRSELALFMFLSSLFAANNASAEPGRIIVGADTTPVFSLTDTYPNSSIAGNQTFFLNALGSGNSVIVRETSASAFADTEVAEFYNLQDGVHAVVSASPVSSTSLESADLYVAPLVSTAFSDAEALELAKFVNSGGALLLLGEFDSGIGVTANGHINSLLTRLSSEIRISNGSFDIGIQSAIGDRILPSSITTGVTSFAYGGTSTVLGGTPLLLLSNGSTFFAMEVSAVPEPSVVSMLIIGIAVITRRGLLRSE